MDAQHPDAAVMQEPTYEQRRAIMEGERSASLDAVEAGTGPFLPGSRRAYEGGFSNGWDRAIRRYATPQPAASAAAESVLRDTMATLAIRTDGNLLELVQRARHFLFDFKAGRDARQAIIEDLRGAASAASGGDAVPVTDAEVKRALCFMCIPDFKKPHEQMRDALESFIDDRAATAPLQPLQPRAPADEPATWLPTPHNINALPAPVRDYIHQLETKTDPAGTVRENVMLQDANRGLQVMYRNAVAAGRATTPQQADPYLQTR